MHFGMFSASDECFRHVFCRATAAAAIGLAAISWTGSAIALTATGVAVGSIGSSTEVSVKENVSIGNDAIKYFIPLDGQSGTYGVNGFGTAVDSGFGGGVLSMILRFSPVNPGPGNLSIVFQDLDLSGVNDPTGFFETLQIFDSANLALTPLITATGNTGNASVVGTFDSQTLSMPLTLLGDPLFLVLKFTADFTNRYSHGTNTAEYLIATVTSPDGGVGEVPLPPAALLFGSVLAGGGLLARYRRKRATA